MSTVASMRAVGFALKPDKPEAVQIARELVGAVKARGLIAYGVVDETGAERVAEAELGTRADFLVVLGGDGTLLHAASLLAERPVPILGINLGHLGFLTHCAPDGAAQALERALDGKLPLEERLRLRCVIQRKGGGQLVRHASNDVVVSQGALARLIELTAFVNDIPITRYRADGLIVATPTGSTAYNLAAGGPIMTPDVQAMTIAPICPHTLTNRPLVAPATSRVTIQLSGGAEHVMVTVDGQWGAEFGQHDTLEISRAPLPLMLYRPMQNYFEILRAKLHWGEREGRN